MGMVKLSKELAEERGDTGRWERRWRGSKWPWKKMSSAGDRSIASEVGFLVLLGVLVVLGPVEECREIVKENS